MTAQKYTLVGYADNSDGTEPTLLFVHVESAESADDAQRQLTDALPHDALRQPKGFLCAVFPGHLQEIYGGHALQLLSGGVLRDRPRSLPPVQHSAFVTNAEQAERAERMEHGLRAIAALDPLKDSAKDNEWAEAECFAKAQDIAIAAVGISAKKSSTTTASPSRPRLRP